MIVFLLSILIVSVGKASVNGYGNEDDQDAIGHFRKYLEESGIGNIASYLKKMVSEWKNHSIHIGVTGRSGVGKSTFINTIRGLRADDVGAAPVGVDETTKTIVLYPDKNNTKLIYWDLPGSDRFTENDVWLVNQTKQQQKSYFFVRNKIDAALENERQDHPSRSEHDVMDSIRNNLISQLGDPFLSVYLISTRLKQYNAWDFPKLIIDLIENGPRSKREAMIFSITSNCESVIGQKVRALRQCVWMIATLSAAFNVVPNPGIAIADDIPLLEREMKWYKKTLALDVQSLASAANIHGTTLDELKRYYETLDNKTYSEILFGKVLISFLINKFSAYAVPTIAKEALRYIPFVG